jgi:hypothetical protein
MRFRTFLLEGGNAAVNGFNASPIPISGENFIPRGEFRDLVVDAIRDMNDKFEAEYNEPLYKDFNVVAQGKAFAGSTGAFIDPSISDEAYTAKKPLIGDIDLQVNKMYAEPLKEFLTKNTKKKFGRLKFMGFQDGGLQLMSVWGFPPKYKNIPKYFQVDLELVNFKGTGPTDISLFMRSSAWEDIQHNIKGVLHKFLLQSLTVTDERFFIINKRGLNKVEKGEPLTDKDFSKKIGNKTMVLGPEGIREKYIMVLDKKKKPIVFNNQKVFKELTTKESKMITDMRVVFELVTKKKANPGYIKAFGSFVGILSLLKRFKTPSKLVRGYILNFAHSMWDSKMKAGKTKAEDLEIKGAGWNEIKNSFPKEWASVEKEIVKMRKGFYERF